MGVFVCVFVCVCVCVFCSFDVCMFMFKSLLLSVSHNLPVAKLVHNISTFSCELPRAVLCSSNDHLSLHLQ